MVTCKHVSSSDGEGAGCTRATELDSAEFRSAVCVALRNVSATARDCSVDSIVDVAFFSSALLRLRLRALQGQNEKDPEVNTASFEADRDLVSIAFSLEYEDAVAAAQARAEELASLSSPTTTTP